jgi:hypothetical protein
VCFTYGYLSIDVAALETIMSANKKISTKSLDMVVGATPNHHIRGVAKHHIWPTVVGHDHSQRIDGVTDRPFIFKEVIDHSLEWLGGGHPAGHPKITC